MYGWDDDDDDKDDYEELNKKLFRDAGLARKKADLDKKAKLVQ